MTAFLDQNAYRQADIPHTTRKNEKNGKWTIHPEQ